MATTETRKMVLAAAAVCEDKKAENTRVLELDPADSGFTDFFLITSGTNTRQVVAIADEIELKMKREFATYANSVEGRRQGEWILMDYVDFVVHIFVEEKRAFYDIERLRKSARSVDLAELQTTLAKKTAAIRKAHPLPSATAKVVELSQAPDFDEVPAKNATRRRVAAGKKTAAPKKTAAKSAARKSAAKKTVAKTASAKSTAKSPAKKSATRVAAAASSSKAVTQAPTKKAAAKRSQGSSE